MRTPSGKWARKRQKTTVTTLLDGEFGPTLSLDVFGVVFDEEVGLGSHGRVFEGDIFGVSTSDAVGAGEIEVGEGHVLDGGFLEAFNHAAVAGIAGGDVVDVDVAKDGAAFGERFNGRFGVTQGKNDGVANIMKADVRGNDVLHDAAAAAGAFDADAVVGAIAVAIEEADVTNAAGLFAADGADTMAVGDVATEVRDVLGGPIHFAAFFVATGLDAKSVIADIGVTIVDEDMTTGIGVERVGIRGSWWIDNTTVADVDALAVEEMNGPEGRIDETGPVDADIDAVFDLQEHRAAANRAVGTGVAVLGHVHVRPPGRALAVERAGAGDGDVVEAVGEDERVRAVFGETFPARGDVRIFRAIGFEEDDGVGVDLQGHVVDHVDRAGKKMAGGNADGAATGLMASGNGLAKGVGAGDMRIVDGAVGGDVEHGARTFFGGATDEQRAGRQKEEGAL